MPEELTYDPDLPTPSGAWLAASEAQRRKSVTDYHQAHPIAAGSLQAHAGLHLVVENRLAEGHRVTVDTIARLQRDGLSRHQAVHAVGSVYAKAMYGVLPDPPGTDLRDAGPDARVDAALAALDAQAWLKEHPQ